VRVLGLQFGHDAGIALIEDGRVTFLAQAERITRQKKASGLSYQTISSTLARAGLRSDQIDYCAIVSTQGVDIALDDRSPFAIDVARHPSDNTPSTLERVARAHNLTNPHELLHPTASEADQDQRRERRMSGIISELRIPPEHVKIIPSLNRGLLNAGSPLARPAGLRSLSDGMPSSIAEYEKARWDFNHPATVILDGHRIPASFISHHAAHAAATFYQSSFAVSAIMTLDGGFGLNEGGMFWLGQGTRIIPLRVHTLLLGALYLWVSHRLLKLGGSAEGKMMGLAPYGQPAMFDERFIGNSIDQGGGEEFAKAFGDHIAAKIKASGRYDPADIGNPNKMTAPANADIAASMQKLFEETMMVAIDQLTRILGKIGVSTANICLSGGCMLNCPTNTRIYRETPFTDVHVEPACDDGGLPVGGALWVYHNLMDRSRDLVDPLERGVPYLGLPLADDAIAGALREFKDRITVTEFTDIAAEGARRLAAGQILGWFEARSEIGPRALGHRSIVADPRGKETWARVNTIKGRELWRPLAPSVLEEYAHEWFSGLPPRAPFMMFVGDVIQDNVPAISHIDNTARVQTVSKHCGGYYDLITRFHALTGCAVVMNTSMNGPGEPIAEYPADAINMLLDGRFDALALGEVIVERK